jgi:hypothetical protein
MSNLFRGFILYAHRDYCMVKLAPYYYYELYIGYIVSRDTTYITAFKLKVEAGNYSLFHLVLIGAAQPASTIPLVL